MKKTTKGAIAIAAAITLLLGGAGSLAYWQETATITASQISTGQLRVAVDAQPVWQVTKNGASTPTTITDINAFRMVPGDTVTYSVGFTTTAEGTNLKASAAVTGGAVTGLPTGVTSATVVTYDSASVTPTSFNVPLGTKSGTVKVTVTWPWGTAGSDTAANSMSKTINLASTVVTVTQAQP